MSLSPPLFEVLPRDLSAYREGNTGIPYVHRFASGQPGPHVLINALTHGNEICGMVAATHLLDSGVRPLKGTLTISFANVQAYESFDRGRPFDSRQIDHNLNRVWSAAELEGSLDSIEMRRARELRPVVAAADHVLDIHSTSQDVEPFWVYPAYARNAEVACAIGRPAVHLLMPSGLGSGTPLIQHGRLGEAAGAGTGLVVECGQHFLRSAGEVATTAALDFLGYFGLIERDRPAPGPQRRYELLQTCMVKTPEFRFTRPLVGFEVFADGELIATDGEDEIRALCDGCTVMMPTRAPIVGREAVYLTRPVP
ncbi:succinylglutamate desuccinylase/aspartoacylase family protein [Acidovorax sp. SUPP3334]|uniref:succinylglutamate desuccinylase/aspartoacylase domain-containing protein n=1 Tax=Acidovorax sp. SUPP3334 TaxID=2920881 RepID=UPI0023DE5232|nr:succinylglutamate desuccinylase/aspartoacylase family protein [Acidovorax sp. SUPP3334]GKT24879.1 succinylglutamate desuccinylase/aspartoacylase family protein [Acidovorax sp. SUPP3334]